MINRSSSLHGSNELGNLSVFITSEGLLECGRNNLSNTLRYTCHITPFVPPAIQTPIFQKRKFLVLPFHTSTLYPISASKTRDRDVTITTAICKAAAIACRARAILDPEFLKSPENLAALFFRED